MFTPWYQKDKELKPFPSVLARAEVDGSTVVKLIYGEQEVIFTFAHAIAYYCVEESIFECSAIPGLPNANDFVPTTQNFPAWRSSINFRRELYGHLEFYRTGAALESFFFFGQDHVVLVESIGAVQVQFDEEKKPNLESSVERSRHRTLDEQARKE